LILLAVFRTLGWIFLLAGLAVVGFMLAPDLQFVLTKHASGCGLAHGSCAYGERSEHLTFTLVGGMLAVMGLTFLRAARWVQGVVQHRQQLLRSGTPGDATITDIQDTGGSINGNPMVRITCRIAASGQQPIEVTKVMAVSRLSIPAVGEVRSVRFDPNNPQDFTFAPTQSFAIAQDTSSASTLGIAAPHAQTTSAAPAAVAMAFMSAFMPMAAGATAAALRAALTDPAFKDRLRQARTPEEAREILRGVLGDDVNAMQVGLQHRDALLFGGAAPAQPADTVSQLERLTVLRDRGVLSPDEFEAQKKKILGE
jgi:Short C-terminal domain